MTYTVLLLAGIVAVFGVITLLDWLGRRKDAESPRR
jgi:hypothetical protein